jgi:predicted nuclease of predicted toxin-antitoxin system
LIHRLFQNVRTEIAAALRLESHHVIHASDVDLDRRDDEGVLHWAVAEKLTILTFDIDFAERAYWKREPHYGVVRLRLEPQTPTHVIPILRTFLAAYPPELLRNALVILTDKKARLRRW